MFGKKNQQISPEDIAARQKAMELVEVENTFKRGMISLRDTISPSSLDIQSGHFRLGTKYATTIYVYGYPRELSTGWLSYLINIDEVIDISMFIYPVDTQIVLNNLRKKVSWT